MNAAFFVSAAPTRRELTLTLDSGEEVTQAVHIRELPAIDWRQHFLDEKSPDEAVRVRAVARLISLSVVDEKGERMMTVDQAGQLRPGVSGKLRDFIAEVNGLGAEKKSPMAANCGSGTSSPPGSAAPSQSFKRACRKTSSKRGARTTGPRRSTTNDGSTGSPD